MRRVAFPLSVSVLLAGCQFNQLFPAAVEQPAERQARALAVGYAGNAWQVCESDIEQGCRRPTPKTISMPVVAARPPAPPPRIEPPAAKELAATLRFKSFKTSLDAEATTSLFAFADAVTRAGATGVIGIAVYSDSRGSEEKNRRLAAARAQAIVQWLKQKEVKNRTEIVLRPNCCYVTSNDTLAGRDANRRVEIHIQPDPKQEIK